MTWAYFRPPFGLSLLGLSLVDLSLLSLLGRLSLVGGLGFARFCGALSTAVDAAAGLSCLTLDAGGAALGLGLRVRTFTTDSVVSSTRTN